jgi:hypothetical protein
MITKISGTLERVDPTSNSVELAIGPVVHEVLVTDLVRRWNTSRATRPAETSCLGSSAFSPKWSENSSN